MKRTMLALGCLLPLFAFAAETKVRDVSLDGTISGENVTFTLKMGFDDLPMGGMLKLVEGPVALLEEEMSGEQFRRLWSVMCDSDE